MKRRLAPWLFVGVVGALCWIAAEFVVARAGLLEYPPSMSRGHPTRGYTLRAGFTGESAYGIPFRVSAQGFRTPEVAIPKPPDLRRVLVLGDSVTWGAGVREEETFARQLEHALRKRDACEAEVVNAGVSGYGSVEELDVLEREGLGFEPDVVLVLHVENDNVVISHATGRVSAFLKDHVVYRSYLVGATLQAMRIARWRVQAARAGGDAAAYAAEQQAWAARPGTEESLAALRRIGAVARAHGARVVLASYPNNMSDAALDAPRNALLRQLADEAGMTFVDTGPALRPHHARGLAVSATDLHPSGFAHGLIAGAVESPIAAALGCAPRAPVS
ncbi:MAG: GDSL-type esterase/lipase family protein [Myxococcota bacterium]|nr:GDSL-type esterase/lipase family protein [Myxococcota bacterium]